MGCSASTEAGVRHAAPTAVAAPPSPIAPHPSEVDENKPEPLLSADASVKTDFATHTTQASSFYGFKGGGRSSGSGTGSDSHAARSDTGSELGSISSRGSSTRRFGRSGSSGDALLEKEEESDFENDDFEDADDDGPAADRRAKSIRQHNNVRELGGDHGGEGEVFTGDRIGADAGSGMVKEDRGVKAADENTREAIVASDLSSAEKFAEPPSPASVEGATGEKNPSSPVGAEALAEAPAPVATVAGGVEDERIQILSSPSRDDGDPLGPLSAGRVTSGVALVSSAAAKAEGPAVVPSPPTPRTESASPAAITPVSVRGSLRGIGGTYSPPRVIGGSTGTPSFSGAEPVTSKIPPTAAIPESISLPKPEAPMLVVPLSGLAAADGFPSYESAMRNGILLPCDSLDRTSAFVVFVSHRWLADGGDPGGGLGNAERGGESSAGRAARGGKGGLTPDRRAVKHGLVVEGLNALSSRLPRGRAIYVWIDCCSIDQENEESNRSSARSVAFYMQQSDAVLTPYVESFYPQKDGGEKDQRAEGSGTADGNEAKGWWGVLSGGGGGGAGSGDRKTRGKEGSGTPPFVNPLGQAFGSKQDSTVKESPATVQWPNSYRSLQDYCSRAWCRLEVLLCSSLSLREGGFRYFSAQGQAERILERPHLLYGEHQSRRKLPPEPLPNVGERGWASSLDPLKGELTLPEDMEHIVHAMAILRLPSSALRSTTSPPPMAIPASPNPSSVAATAGSTTLNSTLPSTNNPDEERQDSTRYSLSGGDRVEKAAEANEDVEPGWGGGGSSRRGGTRPGLWAAVGSGFGGGGGGGEGGGTASGGGGGLFGGRTARAGRGEIPPPIETRNLPALADDRGSAAAGSGAPGSDRLMSPAVKGSKMMPSPMRMRTAAATSAMGTDGDIARGDSSMPGWLWDTVFQYPLAEGDTRTQYSDGSTFVGPLKDGMRHGKGAYFFQDGSRYEGGFKEDKRHGEGTLALAGGGRYVGEWESDLQHGQGTFYFADSACFRGLWHQGKKKSGVFTYSSGGRYIGELQGGKRHGTGSFLYPDGSSYEGQWQDNVKHGEGTAGYASGNRYVGQWKIGKSHGEGTYYYATGARYEGQFDNGKCQGRGTYYYANGNRYEGEWKDDMKWGFGTAVYRKKANYEGHFFKDKRHGFGRMWYANAGTYEGEWAAGKPHGQGTATHKDGEKYVGTYKGGLYHGEGCYWYTNGAVYEGEYRNGRVHGKGRATFPSGDSYAGEWKEGAMSGTGVYDFKEEGASYEGDFRNGRMQGVGVYRWPHGDVYRGSWQADRRSGRGRYEWTELGLTFEGTFKDDRRMGRGSIIFPDNSRYECQWENDKAMDSTAEGARSVHYRADGTECSGDCDVRCKEKGGDELRRLMRRINDQRMKQPVTPTVKPDGNGDGANEKDD